MYFVVVETESDIETYICENIHDLVITLSDLADVKKFQYCKVYKGELI